MPRVKKIDTNLILEAIVMLTGLAMLVAKGNNTDSSSPIP